MGLVTSAFLFSGFLIVASLLLVYPGRARSTDSQPRCQAGPVHVRSVPLPAFGGVPSPAPPRSGLAPSPPRRPASGRCIRAGRTVEAGFRPSAEASRFPPPPSPHEQSSRGSPPQGGGEDKLKGDGDSEGACSQAGKAGYPGSWVRLRERGSPAWK